LHILELIIKLGFGAIIVRTLIEGVRKSISDRAKEVQIAKLLKSDVEATVGRINGFVQGIANMIQRNQGVTDNNYYCYPGALPSVDGTYKNSYSEVYRLLEKHDRDAIQDMTTFFAIAHNYDILLGSYRNLYLGQVGINYRTDPNKKYQELSTSLGLGLASEYAQKISAAVDKVIVGRGFWKAIKNRKVYRMVAILCALLFVFIPEREAL
jgi:hypothetical protein